MSYFFALAAALYNQTGEQTYLSWATREWRWFEASGMINSNFLINDGINNDNCKNNGQTTWTYNQGVVLGGLADLYKATKNESLLNIAQKIVDATFRNLAYNDGILREPCEPQKNCDGDQTQFKGIFMRHLGYLYTVTKNKQIGDFIINNANSIWQRARLSTDLHEYIGVYWEGPYTMAGASTQSSACEALNAALLVN